jgi:hypothetical protein
VRLKVALAAPEQLLALALRAKLASLLMGPLVTLGDLPADLVEGLLRRRPPRAWFLTDRPWIPILLRHALHSSSLRLEG